MACYCHLLVTKHFKKSIVVFIALFVAKRLKKATIVVFAFVVITPTKKEKETITSLLPSLFLLQLERRKKWATITSLMLWPFL
jgi:hypothetical protein